jgi:hypothetical protein
VKNGIYKEVYEAAINREMCTYLGDGDDSNDEDYLTSKERWAKERKKREHKGTWIVNLNSVILTKR